MPIHLTTGVPGAGKTLFSLAVLVPQLTEPLEKGGPRRRLVVGGVADLVIDHEMMDVPVFDPNRAGDTEDSHLVREPGQAPLEVPYRADNWYLWCRPGDVLLIDECQTLFRPMASGKKPPRYIAELERHRHYGVDFILITQNPMLVHASVRHLVGVHRFVRRIFGSHHTFVYEWDHCSNHDRVQQATRTRWMHDKAAYGIYRSAVLHTKTVQRIPFVAVVALLAAIALPVIGWNIWHRMQERFYVQAEQTAGQAGDDQARPGAPAAPGQAASVPAAEAAFARQALPESVAGCWSVAGECRCVGTVAGAPVLDVPRSWCEAVAAGRLFPAVSRQAWSVPPIAAINAGQPQAVAAPAEEQAGQGL